MKKLFLMPLLFLLLTATNLNAASSANPLTDIYKQLGIDENISYSCSVEMSSSMGAIPMTFNKIYFKQGNIRSEGKQNGMDFVSIIRKTGQMYTFNAQMGKWMVMNMNFNQQDTPKYEKTGNETVNGKKCDTYKNFDKTLNMTGYLWVWDGIIYKTVFESPQGKTEVIYKDIKKEKLDDALFMPPKDAQIQDMSSLMNSYQRQ